MVVQLAPVDHRQMPDQHIVADLGAVQPGRDMDDAAVLNVGAVPDRDEVHVPAHDAIIPDAGFLADSDVADDSAAGRDERAARDRRRYSAKGQDSDIGHRSEEHTSELQSLMRISYAVFCLKKKKY